MRQRFNQYAIYNFTDEEIINELCNRINTLRLSCCCSQQEFAEKCGLSIITIKRIESGKIKDITLGTLLKIMRVSGTLEGITDLVPDVPESPFLYNEKTGKQRQRCNSKLKALIVKK